MFQVKHRETGAICTVYAVRVCDDGQTKFLFWNFRWEWENADDYEPVEEE